MPLRLHRGTREPRSAAAGGKAPSTFSGTRSRFPVARAPSTQRGCGLRTDGQERGREQAVGERGEGEARATQARASCPLLATRDGTSTNNAERATRQPLRPCAAPRAARELGCALCEPRQLATAPQLPVPTPGRVRSKRAQEAACRGRGAACRAHLAGLQQAGKRSGSLCVRLGGRPHACESHVKPQLPPCRQTRRPQHSTHR